MKKYVIHSSINFCVTVEASDEEEAIELASDMEDKIFQACCKEDTENIKIYSPDWSDCEVYEK